MDDEEILLRETAKLSAKGQRIGNLLAGGAGVALDDDVMSSVAGLVGMSSDLVDDKPAKADRWALAGMRFGSKWATTETAETDVDVSAPVQEVLEVCLRAMHRRGEVLADDTGSALPTLTALLKVGFLNLHPTIVRVGALPLGESATRLRISAVAQEGKIKQHGAEKAVSVMRELVSDELPVAEARSGTPGARAGRARVPPPQGG